MAVELKMPQLGESVHEGTIGKWLKQEGDKVEKYDPVLEVITDKVDTEVTAVESGTLLKILVAEDETVAVGTVLALIGEAGEEVPEGAGLASSAPPPRKEEASTAPATPVSAAPASANNGGGARVSPVAARVAAEHGVDLAQVKGSGRGGQITRDDVQAHLAAQGGASESGPSSGAVAGARSAQAGSAPSDTTSPAPEPTPGRDIGFISPRVARLAAQHGVDLRRVPGSGRDGRITARDVEAFVKSGAAAASPSPSRPAPVLPTGPGLGELVKHTPMRRAIADHMVMSKQTSPHVTTVHEVDMSQVMQAYRAQKPAMAKQGVKLTLTAFMLQALAETIRAFPLVNSSWTDEGIRVHPDVNIGMAVALPGGGLIVPVIRNADEMNLKGMARAVGDLADRARNKQLKPDDVQGGTFTVTNYGTLGSLFGTPVINQPQCAILGTGAIKKRVVVLEGPEGDSIGIRPMMLLALTFDHRILDGGTADPFMQALVARLERFDA